jgi:hypothetical protein
VAKPLLVYLLNLISKDLVMKRLVILITGLMIINLVAFSQYRKYNMYYDFKDYVYQPGDPYNPETAGVASLFIPGLGQMICGETGRGVGFLAGCIGSFSIAVGGLFLNLSVTEPDPDFESKLSMSYYLMYIGLAGSAAIWICSIVDAIRVAKVNNMAFRDRKFNDGKLTFSPIFGMMGSSDKGNRPIVGFSFTGRF